MPTSSEIVKCCSRTTQCRPQPDSLVWEVLSPDHYKSISGTEFFVLSNVDPKFIERTMRYFQSEFPLSDCMHLKRIKGRDILVCPVSLTSREEIEKKIFVGLSHRNILLETAAIGVVKVAADPVLTLKQYSVANALWPIRLTVPLVDSEAPKKLGEIHEKFQKLFDSGNNCLFAKDGVEVFGSCTDPRSAHHYKHAILNACHSVGAVSDYLATDFEVFCLSEPCLMCSMALLHSRVAKVYYLVNKRTEKSAWGGLGSILSIHANKQLNHRFQVFRVVVE